MNEENLFGKLFNSIPLLTEDHIQTILDVMDKEKAIFILIQAVKYAHHNGVYSLGESEVISKSIRILLEKKIDN